MTNLANIRNFSIVAHIDHGKSTLADRLIQTTSTVSDRDMKEQLLDSMDIERERGITIKANTVRIDYIAKDGEKYVLNLIDTPGHVDFAYEVSRSMRAVEGSLLVVDSTQGVEAQTLANVYQAIDADHEIVPILNKIDLPASDCDRVAEQIEDVIGLDASEAIEVSAKSGIGIGTQKPFMFYNGQITTAGITVAQVLSFSLTGSNGMQGFHTINNTHTSTDSAESAVPFAGSRNTSIMVEGQTSYEMTMEIVVDDPRMMGAVGDSDWNY